LSAAEALKLAGRAGTSGDRKRIWEELAKQWLLLADQIEHAARVRNEG
jgi:hypothetical protein